MQKWKLWLALLLLGVMAAHANMSTAMASAGMIHGVLLNPVVTVVEALLLAWLFKASYSYAFFTLLVANYGSFFLGVVLNRPLSQMVGYPLRWLFGDATWYWTVILPIALLLAMALMYALTVLSEVLFTRTLLPSWRAAIRATAVVNAVSYLGLMGFYAYHSDWGFLRLPKEPNAAFVQTTPATIYFIDWQRRLCAVSLTGGEVRVVREGPVPVMSGVLRGMTANLVLDFHSENYSEAQLLLPASHEPPLPLELAYAPKSLNLRGKSESSEKWRPRGFPDWRTEPSPYSFRLTLQGMTVFKDNQTHLEISMNLPFNVDPGQESGYFVVSGPSALPGDYIVYEFAGRVMITHLPTGRTAKLAEGFAPIAILDASGRSRKAARG